jgi:hypothetical protein
LSPEERLDRERNGLVAIRIVCVVILPLRHASKCFSLTFTCHLIVSVLFPVSIHNAPLWLQLLKMTFALEKNTL